MASAKKKLDEYHLKILRQLMTLPVNKECFDCHQRGPTYVNVTIGSFVCTTCSGMLRGLTPPHRVKSISMATFTPDEIDFVKARGNDYCRRTWLGLLDSQQPTKDEQQIKDFMIAKYERKRYYVDPKVAPTIDKTVSGSSSSPSKPSIGSDPTDVIPALSIHSAAHSHPTTLVFKAPTSQANNTSNVFTPEPFADFSNLSIPPPCDPFNSSQSVVAPSQLSFANFDNNPIFNSSSSTGLPGGSETGTVPEEDRYAALKDLDCLMKSKVTESNKEWSTGVSNGINNVWSASALFPTTSSQTKDSNTTSNPFKEDGTCNGGNAVGANPFGNTRQLPTEAVWSAATNGKLSNGFSTSQSLNFAVPKTPWNGEAINNPFVLGTSPQSTGHHHSSNPFL